MSRGRWWPAMAVVHCDGDTYLVLILGLSICSPRLSHIPHNTAAAGLMLDCYSWYIGEWNWVELVVTVVLYSTDLWHDGAAEVPAHTNTAIFQLSPVHCQCHIILTVLTVSVNTANCSILCSNYCSVSDKKLHFQWFTKLNDSTVQQNMNFIYQQIPIKSEKHLLVLSVMFNSVMQSCLLLS